MKNKNQKQKRAAKPVVLYDRPSKNGQNCCVTSYLGKALAE
jgi:hypothetical protein